MLIWKLLTSVIQLYQQSQHRHYSLECSFYFFKIKISVKMPQASWQMRGPLPWETPHSSLASCRPRLQQRSLGRVGAAAGEAARTLPHAHAGGRGSAQRTRGGSGGSKGPGGWVRWNSPDHVAPEPAVLACVTVTTSLDRDPAFSRAPTSLENLRDQG